MAANIITPEDLQQFKLDLLDNIKNMISHNNTSNSKKWLKSPEIKKLLGISSGTLQNLRINGTLPYTKMGGAIYYDYDEIIRILDQNRIHNKF